MTDFLFHKCSPTVLTFQASTACSLGFDGMAFIGASGGEDTSLKIQTLQSF